MRFKTFTLCLLSVAALQTTSRWAGAQERSVEAAKAASKSSPNDPNATLRLARVLRRAGRAVEAVGVLQPAVLRVGAPDSLRYELMRANADSKNHDAAMQACRGVQSIALRHACQGEAFITIRKLGTEAQPQIDKALKLDPTQYEAHLVVGMIAALDGRMSDAETAYREAIAKDPKRTEARLRLAQALESSRRASAAADELRSAIEIDADDPELHFELGRVLPPVYEALDALNKAVQGRASYPQAWGRLGEVALELEKNDDAANAAEKALKDEPSNASWLAVLAEARVRQKRWTDALTAANSALSASPTHGRAKFAQADALAATGDIDAAIDAYSSAFSSLRTDPGPLVHAAQACLAKGRSTTARSFADKVTAQFPKWAPGWEIAGDIASKAGDRESARKAYSLALEGDGDVEKSEIRKKLDAL